MVVIELHLDEELIPIQRALRMSMNEQVSSRLSSPEIVVVAAATCIVGGGGG